MSSCLGTSIHGCDARIPSVGGSPSIADGGSHESSFEALVSDLSASFADAPPEALDGAIASALERLGRFFRVERCAFVDAAAARAEERPIHLWLSEGVDPEVAALPPPLVQELLEIWRHGQTITLPSASHTLSSAGRSHLVAARVSRMIGVPLFAGRTFLGGLGIFSSTAGRSGVDREILRLRSCGGMLVNVLLRRCREHLAERSRARLEGENSCWRRNVELDHASEEIVGHSRAIRDVLRRVELVARTDTAVLLLGETGTGKDLIARQIHRLSRRGDRAMVTVNCAALPASLIDSELFGHEKGAYTGATNRQTGLCEEADGSTLFLDEIGELPRDLQAKLLRFLETGELRRLGNPRPRRVDARVIAASSVDLERAVVEGGFREDLYYRLSTFPIAVPPLRERREDIAPLVSSFIQELRGATGKTIEGIRQKDLAALARYSWPGNIRELKNLVERSMILATTTTLSLQVPAAAGSPWWRERTLAAVERRHILEILEECNWRVSGANGAAAVLGLKPTTLEYKMNKLDIHRPERR